MIAPSLDALSETDKLKLTVLCDVKKICQEVGSGLTNKVTFEKQALELIAEMVWRKIQDYGTDLELFARHGKHTMVNVDDVKLLVRKNESLKERLSKMCEDQNLGRSPQKRRRKDKDTGPEPVAGPSNAPDEVNLVGDFDFNDFMDE